MSSSNHVVVLDGVTKTFAIDDAGHQGRWHGLGRRHRSTFTAVDNASFSVERGELVGLVGANGAGKSTVLKIISRVMYPDKGRVIIGGPIMSLLEVGAAFHPELTARENVYLSGAILGLDTKTVKRSFDGIVALAGVDRFLETPVKRFSSGMRVRLAVAVGLHLDSDAVVLDEVLAVGDASFQRRCLETLDEMSARGDRATLLVSHNMRTIHQLCRRVLVMQQGRLVFDGDPDRAIAEYYAHVAGGSPTAETRLSARTNVHGDGRLIVSAVRLSDESGGPLTPVEGGPLGVQVELDLSANPQPVTLGLRFSSRDGRLLAATEHQVEAADDLTRSDGRVDTRWHTPEVPLAAGQYALSVTVAGADGALLDSADDVITFTVTDVTRPAGSLAAGMAIPHIVLDGDWVVAIPSETPASPRS